MEPWRLLRDPEYDGPLNMAIDEAILEAVEKGGSPPTLRLYRWQTPCLSLGYGQRSADADLERIQDRGWQIVRRMTGGRAILHTDELTYSVTLPIDHPLAQGSIKDSYHRLSGALLAAINSLGVQGGAEKRASGPQKIGPICFEVPSDYEITAGGKKLIGSAQVRRGGVMLQHGSLPLSGDLSRICEALAFPDEAERQIARYRVHHRATTLESATGAQFTWEQAAAAILQAFAATFEIQFCLESLSDSESRRAAELRAIRYANAEWTLCR